MLLLGWNWEKLTKVCDLSGKRQQNEPTWPQWLRDGAVFCLGSSHSYCSTLLICRNDPVPAAGLGFPLHRSLHYALPSSPPFFSLDARLFAALVEKATERGKKNRSFYHDRNYQEVNSKCLLLRFNYRPLNTLLLLVRVQGQTVILMRRVVLRASSHVGRIPPLSLD